ncbi:MAG TPA: lasso peptide biosynthesis B2 protein [Longimicrobium sp.]|nr:lasso peptide biosynthesis B2 protein [Longimicrobium sp.]
MLRWLARLRSAAALPTAERSALARAQAALLGAQLRVWTRPAGALVRPGPAAQPARAAEGDAERARALAAAVDRAASASLFRPACLVRALALHRLLVRDGIPGARIRLGVRREGGGLAAHAWVELDGAVLGDDGRRAPRFLSLHPPALPADAGAAR